MPLITGRGGLYSSGAAHPVAQVNYCVMGNNSGKPHSLGGWVQVTRAEEGELGCWMRVPLVATCSAGPVASTDA